MPRIMHRYLGVILTLFLLAAGCTQESYLDVASPPTIDFTADITEGEAPLSVTFTPLPAGDITHWHWDFGDGQFSNEPGPSHTYTTDGNYIVSLAVMGADGSDLETKVDFISIGRTIISWEEAGHFIGQRKAVEGTIVGTYYASSVNGKPTFLNFHMPYEGYFTCIIWGSDKPKFDKEFPPDPETYLLNRRVLVNGLIKEYPKGSGVPEIILKNPSQVKVIK